MDRYYLNLVASTANVVRSCNPLLSHSCQSSGLHTVPAPCPPRHYLCRQTDGRTLSPVSPWLEIGFGQVLYKSRPTAAKARDIQGARHPRRATSKARDIQGA